MSALVGHFVAGVVLWFAALCLIAALFEIGRGRAIERRRLLRHRIARHVTRRGLVP